MKDKMADRVSRLAEKIKMSEGLLSDTVLEIHPTGIMYITGCRKITRYDRSTVELSFSDFSVSVNGQNLGIENLVNGQISVTGRIKAVEISDD